MGRDFGRDAGGVDLRRTRKRLPPRLRPHDQELPEATALRLLQGLGMAGGGSNASDGPTDLFHVHELSS